MDYSRYIVKNRRHVLSKVDATADPELEKIIASEWKKLQLSRPEPRIFWELIDQIRNSILKEYQISAGQGVTIRPGTTHLNLKTGEQTHGESLPTLYHYTINSGYYKGREQKDILLEAIQWCDSYLKNIEIKYEENKI